MKVKENCKIPKIKDNIESSLDYSTVRSKEDLFGGPLEYSYVKNFDRSYVRSNEDLYKSLFSDCSYVRSNENLYGSSIYYAIPEIYHQDVKHIEFNNKNTKYTFLNYHIVKIFGLIIKRLKIIALKYWKK